MEESQKQKALAGEKKEQVRRFPLAARIDGEMRFDSITFRQTDARAMTVFVAMRTAADKPAREEPFH